MSTPGLARLVVAPLVVFALFLSGCLGGGAAPNDADALDPAPTDDTDSYGGGFGDDNSTTGGNGSGGDPSPSPSPDPEDNETDGNDTSDNQTGDNETGDELPEPEWAPLATATIRPGVKLFVDNPSGSDGYCTSNFVYRSPTNNTVYLGMAAHCTGLQLGAIVHQPPDLTYVNGADGPRIGVVVYSSWISIGFVPEDVGAGDDVHYHDFALIQIDEDQVQNVNPAVLHFGGPTALGDYDLVALGQRAIAYGNTPLRPGPEQVDWQEGVIFGKDNENKAGSTGYVIETLMSGALPGDSGSGLMSKDGKALGALSFISYGVLGARHYYSSVPHALAHLDAQGWDVELVTADLITPGFLP